MATHNQPCPTDPIAALVSRHVDYIALAQCRMISMEWTQTIAAPLIAHTSQANHRVTWTVKDYHCPAQQSAALRRVCKLLPSLANVVERIIGWNIRLERILA